MSAAYGRLLHRYPLATKSVSTGAIFGIGDVAAQCIAKDAEKDVSLSRVLLTATYGLVLQGPALHVWFGRLDAIWPGASAVTVAKKVVTQHLIYAPVNISLFSGWVRYHNAPAMESSGDAMDSAIQNIQDKALSLWMDGNYFWGPLNVLIFSVVPLPHRPLVSNAGNVVWTTYLSYRANQHIVHDGT
ncbi:hypothetical protein DYB30_011409 [Aphanomyces astaci]|uniref:Uncharacterized protein n=1 Tax=Aphanomyces astaci TaxID=112090 RepID=A0A397EFI4_APHAT|nr:hypothetical protein DYB36_003823 [Aphanomyces astaci]RHY78974.1 hypothetical protein DYB30_011409 [Aphanomyces astaci]RHZ29921.1 hypothetical protein DYB31_006390 [Aphanomyces astaci]RHZ38381.1 hypothetical protein DYB26_013139 [Aphanomyces astaci]